MPFPATSARHRAAVAAIAAVLCLLPALCAEDPPALKPMDEDRDPNPPMRIPGGMDPRVESVLVDHFEKGLGGYKTWAAIESYFYLGNLLIEGSKVPFSAFQKKPARFRINLDSPRGELIMAYDGQVAWKKDPAIAPEPAPMAPTDARQFIRDAVFSSHLLYPDQPGKSYELLGFERIEGRTCHKVQVTLPNGLSVLYYVDIESLVIRGQSTVEDGGIEQRVLYRDYRDVAGQPVAFRTLVYRGGSLVHEIAIDRIEVNTGVMPWMFSPPGLPQDVDIETDLIDRDVDKALPGIDATDVTDLSEAVDR